MTNWKKKCFDFYLILFSGFDSNLAFFSFFPPGFLFCLLNVLYPLLTMLTAAPPRLLPLCLLPAPLTVLPPPRLYMCNYFLKIPYCAFIGCF